MVMLDEGKQAAGDVAKNELNQSGSTNAAVNMAISGALCSMDNLNMMAGSIDKRRFVENVSNVVTTNVFFLTSSVEGVVHKTVDSSPVPSSEVSNLRSSLCSLFQVENPLLIRLSEHPSPDTCNAVSSTLWMI